MCCADCKYVKFDAFFGIYKCVKGHGCMDIATSMEAYCDEYEGYKNHIKKIQT